MNYINYFHYDISELIAFNKTHANKFHSLPLMHLLACCQNEPYKSQVALSEETDFFQQNCQFLCPCQR